jgi:proprotein convertase subtilisin/kexin type 5
LPCAANCLKCDINGPRNCDSTQCTLGFVQLTGTLNCTACFNSCPVCDPNNLNSCLDCGPFRYASSGSCLACPSGCQTCSSAVSCSACQLGFTLLGTACQSSLNYPCAMTGSNSQCIQCYLGYTLNNSNCVINLSCS